MTLCSEIVGWKYIQLEQKVVLTIQQVQKHWRRFAFSYYIFLNINYFTGHLSKVSLNNESRKNLWNRQRKVLKICISLNLTATKMYLVNI